MTEEELWLYTLCKKNDVFITDIQLQNLTLFKGFLTDWNSKINLVSRKNIDNLWRGHIALSLSLLFKIDFPVPKRVLDLGTGGGFPGIPLSIMLPNCSFVLVDSTQKKITAVQSMIESLSLSNVAAVWGRAEEVQKKQQYLDSFEVVVARSVSNLTNLLSWGLPFLKIPKSPVVDKNTYRGNKLVIQQPSLITFKGSEIEEEEQIARRSFPEVDLQSIPLIFPGGEEFENTDKKLLVAVRRR